MHEECELRKATSHYRVACLHFAVVHFRYSKNLSGAKAFGIRKGVYGGLGMGFFFFVIFGSYALAFWYGGKLVREEDYTPGRMLIVSISSHIAWRSFSMHNSIASLVACIFPFI